MLPVLFAIYTPCKPKHRKLNPTYVRPGPGHCVDIMTAIKPVNIFYRTDSSKDDRELMTVKHPHQYILMITKLGLYSATLAMIELADGILIFLN